MPLHIIPRRIFAHRVACKALYRACLTQFPRIPAPDDVPSLGHVPLLKHLIRKGFKKNIHVTSPQLVVKELKRGYAAEELLRNAGNGHPAALKQVHDILRQTVHSASLSRLRASPRPRPPKPYNHTLPAPYPGAPKVLDIRPLPKEQLSGRRNVPTLTAANWLPFLRFKRPQSRFLGRVLRDKLEQKKKRWDGIEGCDVLMEVGESEGEWERRVARSVRKELALAEEGGGVVGEGERERIERMREWLEEGEGREYGESKERFYGKENEEGEKERRSLWAAEAARSKYELWETINGENEKSLEVGKKMLGIVEAERGLWEKERQGRKDVKRAKKGKGPGGRGSGSKSAEGEQETVVYNPLGVEGSTERKSTAAQSPQDKGMNTILDLKTGQRNFGTGRGSEGAKWEPKSVNTKPETEEELMERKLKAMQFSQRNAEKAYKNAAPTF